MSEDNVTKLPQEKADLFLTQHSVTPDCRVVEVWYKNRLVCTITGAEGPGVRLISKYQRGVVHLGLVTEVLFSKELIE